MHGTTIKIIGKWNVWVKISQSDHTYILPRTLSIHTYIYIFLQFKFYQLRTLLFYFNHVMTFVRCSPWRWPQKTAAACRNASIFEILQNKLEINLLLGMVLKFHCSHYHETQFCVVPITHNTVTLCLPLLNTYTSHPTKFGAKNI
jgi:hypothetical protein